MEKITEKDNCGQRENTIGQTKNTIRMQMNDELAKTPDNLPKPNDDKACDHLLGTSLPDITLHSTDSDSLDISRIDTAYVILYFFPMMGTSEKELPKGWNDIPGARGCTPQNITINEHYEEITKQNTTIIGISTQKIDELIKTSQLRELSQVLLSDENLEFQKKISIPTFQVENKTMYKRLTVIIKKSKIIKVFYPIFPPDKHIFEILEWLKNNPAENTSMT